MAYGRKTGGRSRRIDYKTCIALDSHTKNKLEELLDPETDLVIYNDVVEMLLHSYNKGQRKAH